MSFTVDPESRPSVADNGSLLVANWNWDNMAHHWQTLLYDLPAWSNLYRPAKYTVWQNHLGKPVYAIFGFLPFDLCWTSYGWSSEAHIVIANGFTTNCCWISALHSLLGSLTTN